MSLLQPEKGTLTPLEPNDNSNKNHNLIILTLYYTIYISEKCYFGSLPGELIQYQLRLLPGYHLSFVTLR